MYFQTIRVCAIALLLLISGASYSQHKIKNEKFSINFPIEPEYESQTSDMEVGTITVHTYVARNEATSVVYILSYFDYPPNTFDSELTNEVLEGAMNGFIGELDLELETLDNIYVGNTKGISYSATNDYFYAAGNNYMVGERLYQIVTITIGDYASEEQLNSFNNTFKFNP
jgi:hypothetical protein